MNYNEFMTYTEENKDEYLKKISVIITNNVSKWLKQNFNIKMEINDKYPMNGFTIGEIEDQPNLIKIEYQYEYGNLICEFCFNNNTLNLINFHSLSIDETIIKKFGFCNEEFTISMDNDFVLNHITNNIKTTMLKKGNHIVSYFEIDVKENTKSKIISFNNGAADTVNLNIEKDNNFYMDFHFIIDSIYGKYKNNTIKEDLFDKYADITNGSSFESFLYSFKNDYENNYETIQENIEVIKIMAI